MITEAVYDDAEFTDSDAAARALTKAGSKFLC